LCSAAVIHPKFVLDATRQTSSSDRFVESRTRLVCRKISEITVVIFGAERESQSRAGTLANTHTHTKKKERKEISKKKIKK